MGLFDFVGDLLGGGEPRQDQPTYAGWGKHGSRVTRNYLKGLEDQARRQRKRTLAGMRKAYETGYTGARSGYLADVEGVRGAAAERLGALTTRFDSTLKQTRQQAMRDATVRGFGASTKSLALGATGDLAMRREAALGDVRGQRAAALGQLEGQYMRDAARRKSQYLGARSGVQEVPSSYFKFLRRKAKHGAIEPWHLLRTAPPNPMAGAHAQGMGSLLGAGVGGYFGGPPGAAVGAGLGGIFGGGLFL